MSAYDLDRALQHLVDGYCHLLQLKHCLGWRGEQWQPGHTLKLLLTGYNGARNTGADVRVAEMVRQLRHILGADQVALTVTTIDPRLTDGYFPGAQQIRLPYMFPGFLYRQCPQHHGVVACEGSMFTSKFADALSTMMATSLGMAALEGKLSVGYGAEAGAMTAPLRRFVQRHCQDAFILCRNAASRTIVGNELGLRSASGTDTAWTFEPAPPARGAALLRAAGWDGAQPVLVVCPINPFWWPVKPSLSKAIACGLVGKYRAQRYSALYFHHAAAQTERHYHAYLQALAHAISIFTRDRNLFTVLIGMERLDRRACHDLAARLTPQPAVFVSDTYNMYDLVSVLRMGALLVSSRYHAIVTSMPAQVPSVGITMDERIRNLMHDRGHADLLLEVDDPDLAGKLLSLLRRLGQDREMIAAEIGQALPQQLQRMGEMGLAFMDEVARVYPQFPRRLCTRSWEAYLPPLPPGVTRVMEQFA
jgi:polysaccharide pyruvyl transferase WcaK-like protein